MPIRITGMNSGLDTEAIIKELASAKSYKKTKMEKAQTKLGWKQEAWKTLNTKIYNFYTKVLDNVRFKSDYTKKKTTCSNANAVSVTTGLDSPNCVQQISVDKLAKAGYMTGGQLGGGTSGYTSASTMADLGLTADTSFSVTTGGTTTQINLTADTTISDVVNQLNAAGVTANFDEKNQRFFVSANGFGTEKDFTFGGDTAAIDMLGMGSTANKIAGQKAQITLNGVQYTSDTNVFEVNGLTITAKEETTSPVTLTTETDTSGIYNMVKNFIKEYNTLINEMDKLYNADSAKGYEPLTDEEKDAMSDTEVEKWETKIKDALLRKDTTLSGVSSAMREAMSSGVEMSDGSKMYLWNFGIETMSYWEAADNERNAYHIAGDSDDTSTSKADNELMAMISKDPDKVAEFFSGLASNLYDALGEKMAKIDGVSSAFTVYNDITLQEEYDEYTDKIKTQQKKVDEYMDRYYAKFSAMETALATLQSKQNAVSQLLGM